MMNPIYFKDTLCHGSGFVKNNILGLDSLGIDEVYSELLPADKVEKVEELLRVKLGKAKLAFVGDGINDAPVSLQFFHKQAADRIQHRKNHNTYIRKNSQIHICDSHSP